MLSHLEEVLEEVKRERIRQDTLWGKKFDDTHTQNDWVAFITCYAGKGMRKMPGEEGQQYPGPESFRWAMIQVAALALAAVEALDRHPRLHAAEVSDAV